MHGASEDILIVGNLLSSRAGAIRDKPLIFETETPNECFIDSLGDLSTDSKSLIKCQQKFHRI